MKDDAPALLPAGIHSLSWQQMRELCVTSAYRRTLADGLDAFAAELRTLQVRGWMWVDGSFVTTKPEPSDVDLAVLVTPESAQLSSVYRARLEELFWTPRRASVSLYRCDAYWVDSGNRVQRAYWRGQFGFGHDEVTPKGIIELPL